MSLFLSIEHRQVEANAPEDEAKDAAPDETGDATTHEVWMLLSCCRNIVISIVMGVSQNRWFISWTIPSFEMADN